MSFYKAIRGPLNKTCILVGSGVPIYLVAKLSDAILCWHDEGLPIWANLIREALRLVKRMLQTGWFVIYHGTRRLISLTPDVKDQSELIEDNIERYGDLRKLLEHPLTNIPIIKPAVTHSHGPAAALRSGVNAKMTQVVCQAGMVPYHMSQARTDVGDGTRYFYFLKDLKQKFRHVDLTEKHVIILTDVDFYVDMPMVLKEGRPVMMFTLSPEYAAYKDDQCSYTITDNKLQYNVSGGAKFEHEIWDYDHDTISVVDDCWNLIVYDVSQKKIDQDPNRRIITLTPSAKVAWPFYIGLGHSRLQRKRFTYKGTNIVRNRVSGKVSIAKSGTYIPIILDEDDYEAIRIRVGRKGDKAVISDVEAILNKISYPKAYTIAPVLFDMICDVCEVENQVTTSATKVTSLTFQTIGTLVTEDADEVGQAFATPIVTNPAVFAGKTANNDEATIAGRVDKVKNDMVPPQNYFGYATEFVDLLVGDLRGKGGPIEASDVIAIQNKAQQAARSQRVKETMGTAANCTLTCFIKTEPYPSLNDPRNITTCSPEFTIQMSRYTYPEKEDILKKKEWYGPCKTPKKVVRQLRKIASNCDRVIETDYSRFDGTISCFLQNNIARASAMAWCRAEDREALEMLYSKLFTKKAITSSGLRFNPGWGTRSGSPITSDGNTKINAYISYVAHREMGATPAEAWVRLDQALFCGDDGVQLYYPGLDEVLETVSAKLGLKLKAAVRVLGVDTVGYCGRWFPDLKTSDTSCQDVLRTLPKLHLSANGGMNPYQAAYNKAIGYITTDCNTPLIGTWAKQVITICETYRVSDVKGMTGEEEYKLTQPWPQPDVEMLKEMVCKELKIVGPELGLAESAIQKTRTLMTFPVVYDNPRTDRITAIVGGDILGPTNEEPKKQCQESKSIAHNSPGATKSKGRQPEMQSNNKFKPSSQKHSNNKAGQGNSASQPKAQTKPKSTNSSTNLNENSQSVSASQPPCQQQSKDTPTPPDQNSRNKRKKQLAKAKKLQAKQTTTAA